MKLTIVYADFYAVRCDLQHANVWHEPTNRVVSVDLTPEQCAILAPKKVGTEYGKDQYEEIQHVIFEAKERV